MGYFKNMFAPPKRCEINIQAVELNEISGGPKKKAWIDMGIPLL